MQEGYKYDVFLSYKRQYPVGTWVKKYLYRYFPGYLSDAIGGRKVEVFFDQFCIQTGDDWKNTLKEGLHRSKILLAVCSPGYFCSDWCVSEWQTFALREKVVQTSILKMPIRHNDGEHFPEDANANQMMDFSDCNLTMPAFKKSSQALIFEMKLQKLAKEVAERLKDVPPFNPNWPIISPQSEIRVLPGNGPVEQGGLLTSPTTGLLRIS